MNKTLPSEPELAGIPVNDVHSRLNACRVAQRIEARTIDHVGADCFMWATDYPHPDHPGGWAHALERFVAPLSEETRARVLGGNVRRIYGL